MVSHLVELILGAIQSLGWLGVFFGALAEELIYFIPSSLVQLTAGAVLLSSHPFSWKLVLMSILVVGIPAAIGVVIGSLPYYALGYFGGKLAIDKWGKYLGVTWQNVEDLDAKLSKTWKDDAIFTLLRALPILPSVVLSIGPGILRMPMRTYLLGSIVGTLVRATVMGFVGSRLGAGIESASGIFGSIEKVGFLVLAATLVLFGLYYGYARYKKKNSSAS
jgi:membrane protein DedA with SNARE-associated domain